MDPKKTPGAGNGTNSPEQTPAPETPVGKNYPNGAQSNAPSEPQYDGQYYPEDQYAGQDQYYGQDPYANQQGQYYGQDPYATQQGQYNAQGQYDAQDPYATQQGQYGAQDPYATQQTQYNEQDPYATQQGQYDAQDPYASQQDPYATQQDPQYAPDAPRYAGPGYEQPEPPADGPAPQEPKKRHISRKIFVAVGIVAVLAVVLIGTFLFGKPTNKIIQAGSRTIQKLRQEAGEYIGVDMSKLEQEVAEKGPEMHFSFALQPPGYAADKVEFSFDAAFDLKDKTAAADLNVNAKGMQMETKASIENDEWRLSVPAASDKIITGKLSTLGSDIASSVFGQSMTDEEKAQLNQYNMSFDDLIKRFTGIGSASDKELETALRELLSAAEIKKVDARSLEIGDRTVKAASFDITITMDSLLKLRKDLGGAPLDLPDGADADDLKNASYTLGVDLYDGYIRRLILDVPNGEGQLIITLAGEQALSDHMTFEVIPAVKGEAGGALVFTTDRSQPVRTTAIALKSRGITVKVATLRVDTQAGAWKIETEPMLGVPIDWSGKLGLDPQTGHLVFTMGELKTAMMTLDINVNYDFGPVSHPPVMLQGPTVELKDLTESDLRQMSESFEQHLKPNGMN